MSADKELCDSLYELEAIGVAAARHIKYQSSKIEHLQKLLREVLDAIPDFVDGRNDELVARIEVALGIPQDEEE